MVFSKFSKIFIKVRQDCLEKEANTKFLQPYMYILYLRKCTIQTWAETWRRIWGDQKIFRGPISGKISIFRVKISDDLFCSHRPGSSDFSFLYPHFPYVYYIKCRMTISSQEKHNFSLSSCFHAHPTTLLLKILGGPMHGRSPYLKFWGGPFPPVPLGLCPCIQNY